MYNNNNNNKNEEKKMGSVLIVLYISDWVKSSNNLGIVVVVVVVKIPPFESSACQRLSTLLGLMIFNSAKGGGSWLSLAANSGSHPYRAVLALKVYHTQTERAKRGILAISKSKIASLEYRVPRPTEYKYVNIARCVSSVGVGVVETWHSLSSVTRAYFVTPSLILSSFL